MTPAFLKNNADMIDAARHCIEHRKFLPALVLMYSHIDTLAWAGSRKGGQRVRQVFEEWTERWLLPELKLHAPTLSATDLYAARCGVLHSLTSESQLSASGVARRIAYAWGNGDTAVLNEAISHIQPPVSIVSLHYDQFLSALHRAATSFFDSASDDLTLRVALEEAAGKHYMNIAAS